MPIEGKNKAKTCCFQNTAKSGVTVYFGEKEVIRAGLRLLEENEKKLQQLSAAIREGEESGICENFDSQNHLQELKKKHRKHPQSVLGFT